MELKKEQLDWIRSNKVLSLIIVLIAFCGYLVNHSFDQYEQRHKEDMELLTYYRDAVRIFQDGAIRSAEIEKASRILKKNAQ